MKDRAYWRKMIRRTIPWFRHPIQRFRFERAIHGPPWDWAEQMFGFDLTILALLLAGIGLAMGGGE